MSPKSEHRRVENAEDFTQWDWGDPPEGKPSDKLNIVAQLTEWAGDIARESCPIGAAIALEELARNGFFVLRGTVDKGLLVEFMGTDQFVICDELDIVTEAIDHFEDPQRISAHLRHLADAIDAGCRAEQPPSDPSA